MRTWAFCKRKEQKAPGDLKAQPRKKVPARKSTKLTAKSNLAATVMVVVKEAAG